MEAVTTLLVSVIASVIAEVVVHFAGKLIRKLYGLVCKWLDGKD